MMRITLFILLIILTTATSNNLSGQDKQMDLGTYDLWNTIGGAQISQNGQWVCYELLPGKGDPQVILYNTADQSSMSFSRASDPQFDYNNQVITFNISASIDSLEKLERDKVDKDDWPKDSLGIYHLEKAVFDKIAQMKSYSMPQESGGYIAIHLEASEDSMAIKKENKKNGSTLLVYDTHNAQAVPFNYVTAYSLAERAGCLVMQSTGSDSINIDHIILTHTSENITDTLLVENADYSYFTFNEKGSSLAFLMASDSLKNYESDPVLMIWNNKEKSLTRLIDHSHPILLEDWRISPYRKPEWSKNGDRLYFAIHKKLPLVDSTLLDSEKVNLEVWHYQDGLLYTQQKEKIKSEKERSYTVMYDFPNDKMIKLATQENPEVAYDDSFKSDYILSSIQTSYEKYISWIGYAFRDVFLTNIRTGEKKLIAERVQGTPRMSPAENYVYWFNRPDTSWYAYNIHSENLVRLTEGAYYDELNDRPMHPYGSGMLGWLEEDEALIIYDQYDIWSINPENGSELRITEGRESKLQYRHIRLDSDVDSYASDTSILLKIFDEKDKSSGYAMLDLNNSHIKLMLKGPFNYSNRIYKAEQSKELVFTKESFEQYPDLILSTLDFKSQKKISDANPQQSEYAWGSIELFKWQNFEEEPVEGLLVKPPNFDPDKKYPLIINFYERNSHRLHNHRAPFPHRSTINYSYWANKGYVIFNPDIKYKIGQPGQSCYNAVMSGVEALLEEGFVDQSKMGLQGHSWGGYQIADLITKTPDFACAEAGAPVVNMTSAYGGIRWGTGKSRMFQYEKTQSRLGATLWERPELYLENSPLFKMDLVKTPVLILHNDHDGHVPWYQGIEYFVALRRLGKPAWLLNYNDEPHWPLKRQNRLDFNKRLEQFFDHYLMEQPMPQWMMNGVPAHRADIENGLGY